MGDAGGERVTTATSGSLKSPVSLRISLEFSMVAENAKLTWKFVFFPTKTTTQIVLFFTQFVMFFFYKKCVIIVILIIVIIWIIVIL